MTLAYESSGQDFIYHYIIISVILYIYIIIVSFLYRDDITNLKSFRCVLRSMLSITG